MPDDEDALRSIGKTHMLEKARMGLGQFAVTAGHLIAHPAQLRQVPRLLREVNARPLDLRTPWWPYAIVAYVDRELPDPSRVLEFGGGGSSLWLVDRGAKLTVVEHHPEWVRQLRGVLPASVEIFDVPPLTTGR